MPEEVELAVLVDCPRCGRHGATDNQNPHICVDCAKTENVRYTNIRQHQGDWVAEARAQGLAPWLQQPGESQWEYTVWCVYRDAYPGKKPTYAMVAEQLDTTYNVVQKMAQRWTFPIRMQLWMAECDRITMVQRKDEILGMNKDHIDMATKLRQKLGIAIDAIDPLMLKPAEVASLAKLASEMERKARIDTETQETARRELLVDNLNPELKKTQTKQGDLADVLQILMQTGALKNIKAVGIKETTTREIVAVDDEGNSASMLQEEDE